MIYLIFVRTSHDVKEEVDVASVDDRQPVEHYNFRVGSMRFIEEVLFERPLLFRGWKDIFVVVFR